jgi:hypothetical protein
MTENFGEEIKFVRENEEVLLKLYTKKSATYFSIWLTSRKIDYRFVTVHNEDDFFCESNEDEEYEYLFWIKKDDWNYLKDDICWRED